MSGDDVIVLCYHAVSADWPEVTAVTPANLEKQLRWIAGRGYRGVTFHEAITSPPGRKLVAVTFDDGFRSIFETAFPVLSDVGLPGTVFVPTTFVDAGAPLAWPGLERWLSSPHRRELAPLSWNELRELAAHGWEIGSHTCTHPDLTRLDDASARAELTRSRHVCEERLERGCRSLAYPYGAVDDRVVAHAGEAGYVSACLLTWRLPPPRALAWPRVGVFRGDGQLRFRAKVSRGVRRVREPRAWDTLQAFAARVRGGTRGWGQGEIGA